jgi:Putative peptidoglycan binding domain
VVARDTEPATDDQAIRDARGAKTVEVDRRNIWLTAPLLVTLVGLIGTGVGAVLQGYWNNRLERDKFEYSLIQKALETADKGEAARNLKFIVNAGLISGFNSEKILALADKPEQLPTFVGAAISDGSLTIRDVKTILTHLNMYRGPINSDIDQEFMSAIRAFQQSRGLVADGNIGQVTYAKLREAWPEYFSSK